MLNALQIQDFHRRFRNLSHPPPTPQIKLSQITLWQIKIWQIKLWQA